MDRSLHVFRSHAWFLSMIGLFADAWVRGDSFALDRAYRTLSIFGPRS